MPGGGGLPGYCIPLLGQHRETPTLSGTKIATPYPYWHKRVIILHPHWHNHWKNHTLSGTHLVFKTLPLVAHCLKALPSVALKLAKMVP